MNRQNSFKPFCRFNLHGTVLADNLENCFAKYFNKTNGKLPILIDFKNAEYVDIATLANCISYLVLRCNKGYDTYIGLPDNEVIRAFFYVWRFYDAIKDATNKNLRKIILYEDHHYLDEKQRIYTGIGNGLDNLEYDPDWNENQNSKRNFFEFKTFFNRDRTKIKPQGQFYSEPRKESKRWSSPLISSVLKKHIRGNTEKDDIARVIIYEAIANAVRHPAASLIQVVSKFERKDKSSIHFNDQKKYTNKKKNIEGYLRICIWDDGDTIASTLLSPLLEDKSIRSIKLPIYMYEKIFVQIRSFDEMIKKERIVDQSETPTKETPESRILLSSTYPGISRAVSEYVTEVEPFEEKNSSDDLSTLSWKQGMGLYALTRAVLDQFQGTLFIRSGRYRLIMEVAHDTYRIKHKVRYKCKITQYPKYFPPYKGNLLVISLPVNI